MTIKGCIIRTLLNFKLFFLTKIIKCDKLNAYAGVAELADALDLGSSEHSCRFKSCHPHQIKATRVNLELFLFYKGGGT